MTDSRLPNVPRSCSARTESGTMATIDAFRLLVQRSKVVAQRPRAHREHHVVHGDIECVL